MSRVLAIEVTPTELRIAQVERRLGTTRLVACERIPCTTTTARRTALEPALAWRPTQIVSTLPVSATVHRVLTLPFHDRRRVRETVALELLGQLPADPGDVATGHVALETTAEGTRVWAMLARQTSIATLRQALREAGASPLRVDATLLGVWHLVGAGHTSDAALVLADGRASAVAVRRGGILVGLRALAADPAANPTAFAAEVHWALTALGGAPHIILLGTDGSSEIARTLGDTCRASVVAIADVIVPTWRADALSACAVSVGLAAGAGLVLDIESDAVDTRRRTRRIGALAAAGVLLSVIDVGLVRWHLVRRDRALVAAVQSTATAALPAGTRVIAPRTQLEAVAGTLGTRPATASQVLGLLRDLSARIPAGVRIELDELTVDGDAVRLHGRADRFETIDVAIRALATSSALRDVTAEDSRATVDGRGVEFGIRATWHPSLGAPS